MAFKDFLVSVKKEDNGVSDDQVLEWIKMTPAQKAEIIKEAKESGNKETILALNETAKLWEDVVAFYSASKEVQQDALEYSKDEKPLHEILTLLSEEESREEIGKALKGFDKDIDKYQDRMGKISDKDIPLISKAARKLRSNAGDAEVAVKAGRVANFMGAGKEGTLKAMKTAGTVSQKAKEVAGDTGGALKRLASEHGGKVAAATAAGLGALGLVKAMRRKKAAES